MENEEPSKEAKEKGFPRNHRHKLCCLRQELVDAFVEWVSFIMDLNNCIFKLLEFSLYFNYFFPSSARYMMFIKYAAYHLQQIGLKNFVKEKVNIH